MRKDMFRPKTEMGEGILDALLKKHPHHDRSARNPGDIHYIVRWRVQILTSEARTLVALYHLIYVASLLTYRQATNGSVNASEAGNGTGPLLSYSAVSQQEVRRVRTGSSINLLSKFREGKLLLFGAAQDVRKSVFGWATTTRTQYFVPLNNI